jgi:hypothetical protein
MGSQIVCGALNGFDSRFVDARQERIVPAFHGGSVDTDQEVRRTERILTEGNHSDQVRALDDQIPSRIVWPVPELRNGF